MQVSAISQANTLNNKRNLSPNNSINVNFQGVHGTKLLNKLSETNNLEKSEVFDAMKGLFGFKSNRVKDIVSSFLDEIKELRQEVVAISAGKNAKLEEAERLYNEKLNNSLLREKQLNNTLQFKNEKIQQLTTEVEKLTEANKKYSLMSNVKSMDEIGVVTKSQVLDAAKKSYENLGTARESMYTFLTTGKGQEEVLAQVERSNVLAKAWKDGMSENPEIVEKVRGYNLYNITIPTNTVDNLKSLVKGALLGTKDDIWMYSKTMQNQIKENAKAIIFPHMNERFSNHKMTDFEKAKVLNEECTKLIKETIFERKAFEKGFNYLQNSEDVRIKTHIQGGNYLPEQTRLVMDDDRVFDYIGIREIGYYQK
jgi:hypothetical protein